VIGGITALFMGFFLIKTTSNASWRCAVGLHDGRARHLRPPLPCSILMTHAFFKALLFLAAGSVILGVHHNRCWWADSQSTLLP
jgi:hypothetical protein